MARIRSRSLRRSRSGGQGPGIVARLFLTVWAIIFGGAGLAMFVAMGNETLRNAAARSWLETPATVVSSRIDHEPQSDGDPYVLRARLAYQGGEGIEPLTADHEVRSDDYNRLQRMALRLQEGRPATLFVDPDDPSQTALEQPSLASAFGLLFPIPFMVIGFGVLAAVWWPRGRTVAKDDGIETPISSRADRHRWLPLGLTLFFSIFLLVGLAGTYFLGVRPLLQSWDAQSWVATPAVVEHSNIRRHRGDDSDTYSLDILYRYTVDGQELRSNWYDFTTGSSSSYGWRDEVVRNHPPGTATTCYVNPADPTEAVLHRGVSSDIFFALIPMVFLVVGLGGVLFVPRMVARKQGLHSGRKAPWLPAAAAANQPATARDLLTSRPDSEPVVFTSGKGRVGKVALLLFFALVWNGIISIFVYHAWFSDGGGGEWFLRIFLIPFMLVGVGVICAVGYTAAACFNPQVRLALNTWEPALGEVLRVDWSLSGATHRLQDFRIELEGQEEATYRRGTDTVTDRSTFAIIPLLELTEPTKIAAGGTVQFRIPTDTMHSFGGRNNRITWKLCARGSVHRWPDVSDEFAITLHPQITAAARRTPDTEVLA